MHLLLLKRPLCFFFNHAVGNEIREDRFVCYLKYPYRHLCCHILKIQWKAETPWKLHLCINAKPKMNKSWLLLIGLLSVVWTSKKHKSNLKLLLPTSTSTSSSSFRAAFRQELISFLRSSSSLLSAFRCSRSTYNGVLRSDRPRITWRNRL